VLPVTCGVCCCSVYGLDKIDFDFFHFAALNNGGGYDIPMRTYAVATMDVGIVRIASGYAFQSKILKGNFCPTPVQLFRANGE
jgi:hypothetical protein